jgi:hypothetical protein
MYMAVVPRQLVPRQLACACGKAGWRVAEFLKSAATLSQQEKNNNKNSSGVQ